MNATNHALATVSNAYEAFNQLARENVINEACTRIIIRGDKYRPIKYAHDVRCPVLLQICEKDRLVSLESIEKPAGSCLNGLKS